MCLKKLLINILSNKFFQKYDRKYEAPKTMPKIFSASAYNYTTKNLNLILNKFSK